MKKLLLLTNIVLISSSYAVVTVLDPATQAYNTREASKDVNTLANYGTQVSSTITKMADAKDAVTQLQNLKGLQKLQASQNLCNLCSATDNQKLVDYSTSINDDLCSQFGYAYKNLTGVQKSFNSLKDIINLFSSDPRSAGLALQQASITAAQTTNSTLAQMQVMQAQMIQKQLADEKRQQQAGFNAIQTLQTTRPSL